jgi:ABC transporter related protein
MLRVIDLDFKNILKNIDIEVRDNEIVSIIAANNVGKTLLCNILNTTVSTTSNIYLNNYDINENKHNYLRRISFIPESFFFINDLVYQEIKMPLYNLNFNIKEINEMYRKVVKYLNIQYLCDKSIKELNNYEKFLIYLAKSLITKPKIIIIDDVFKNLDKNYYTQIFLLLNKLKKHTSFLITSIYFDPILYSDYVYYLENKTIKYKGKKEKIFKLDNELVKGNININDIILSSLALNCYEVMDTVVRDKEELVDILW